MAKTMHSLHCQQSSLSMHSMALSDTRGHCHVHTRLHAQGPMPCLLTQLSCVFTRTFLAFLTRRAPVHALRSLPFSLIHSRTIVHACLCTAELQWKARRLSAGIFAGLSFWVTGLPASSSSSSHGRGAGPEARQALDRSGSSGCGR